MISYTTIKVPKEFVRSARMVQRELVRRGIDHLPVEFEALVEDTVCPSCGKPMNEVDSERLLTCSCGLSKHKVELADPGEDIMKAVGIGALVGLGIFSLARMLGSVDRTPGAAKAAAKRIDARSRPGRAKRPTTKELVNEGRVKA